MTQQESDRLFENLKKLSSKDSFTSHPIFHVMCMTLAVNYIGLAETNLKSGDLRGALAALDSLAQILPELSARTERLSPGRIPNYKEKCKRRFPLTSKQISRLRLNKVFAPTTPWCHCFNSEIAVLLNGKI